MRLETTYDNRIISAMRYEGRVRTNRADTCVNLLFCLLLSASLLVTTFNGAIRALVGNTYKLDTLLFYGVYALIVYLALPRLLRAIKMTDLIGLMALGAIYAFSMLMPYGDDPIHSQVLGEIALKCIPAYIVAISVRDYGQLRHFLRITAYLIIGATLFSTFVLKSAFENSYSQQYGYEVLPSAVILILEVFEKDKWQFKAINIALILIAMILMLMSGARGPVVCTVGALVMVIGLKSIPLTGKQLIAIFICIAVGIVLYLYFDEITAYLLQISEKAGLSTRNFTQLAQGTFLSNTSGRDPIYDYAWNYIGDHWLWGTGVVNDRVWINNAVMMETSAIGAYPHNIFIEWMMQFGLVAGVCICILFLLQAGKYAFGQYDKKFKTIFLIILATGCFPLFFSGSYISYPLFYAALGICRGYKRHRTKEEAAQ